MSLFAAAWVIARRDYTATVLSRTFLMFLLGPLLPILFGVGFGAIASHGVTAADERPVVVVAMMPAEAKALLDAGSRISARLRHSGLPILRPAESDHPTATLDDPAVAAVLSGSLEQPVLTGPRAGVDDTRGPITLIIGDAQREAALAHAGIQARTAAPAIRILAEPNVEPHDRSHDERTVARIGQGVLFILTLLLANMLLWNLVEEKSNKVIEVLAAAVPVRAIFLGKLVAMLAVSLTAVLAWTSVAALTASAVLPPHPALPMPAVGWTAYLLLGLLYFISSFLLFGGVLLGLGAQLGSMREIQSVTLPATMVQLILFGFASSAVGRPDAPGALAAAAFPLSSPLAMIARGGELPEIWPHVVALGWQAVWIVLIIAFAAERFRSGVLQSGPARRG
jgi:ABC-2 type transport system permease protein